MLVEKEKSKRWFNILMVKIDKNLDKFKGKVLFPKKLALAEELLQRAKFPSELKTKFNIL